MKTIGLDSPYVFGTLSPRSQITVLGVCIFGREISVISLFGCNFYIFINNEALLVYENVHSVLERQTYMPHIRLKFETKLLARSSSFI